MLGHCQFDKIQNFSFTKKHMKISSAKLRPFSPEGVGVGVGVVGLGVGVGVGVGWGDGVGGSGGWGGGVGVGGGGGSWTVDELIKPCYVESGLFQCDLGQYHGCWLLVSSHRQVHSPYVIDSNITFGSVCSSRNGSNYLRHILWGGMIQNE